MNNACHKKKLQIRNLQMYIFMYTAGKLLKYKQVTKHTQLNEWTGQISCYDPWQKTKPCDL